MEPSKITSYTVVITTYHDLRKGVEQIVGGMEQIVGGTNAP